ncbi:beta-N-acetylhexosaminidase [Caulobacter sp. NIBR2454]|uniref:beta-N-acetylhexosaminidase n=1 Tax=Caulobacter sp. NIBR2454 TaxID=3015996 RepID=UPI0022B72251|nr:beta-N-acetylhexosaminidase [Caulobacter sp. NIBR2454]
MSHACILGCSGTRLTRHEKEFFKAAQPWGFILFKRNIETPDQVRRLTDELRETLQRPDAPILIDQEGGRVARLQPRHWRRYPAGRAYAEIAHNDPLAARELVRLGARLMAHDLSSIGINVDCVPVLDVPAPDGHEIIGDRAYSTNPDQVAQLGRAAAEGLIAGGVLPVIKHIPGHGRAKSDSHEELPVVDATLEELDARDFAPFRSLSDMPMAMTAHVVYIALDWRRPATLSKRVITQTIRHSLGFEGLLMSDDLSMKALKGSFEARTRAALAAGCDVVLHCNGDMQEMKSVVTACRPLFGKAKKRAEAALNRLAIRPEPFDVAEGRSRFDSAFSRVLAG